MMRFWPLRKKGNQAHDHSQPQKYGSTDCRPQSASRPPFLRTMAFAMFP